MPLQIPLNAIRGIADPHRPIQINPSNGSLVEVDKPIWVDASATDVHGNQAHCQFWYQAAIKDCPLWYAFKKHSLFANLNILGKSIWRILIAQQGRKTVIKLWCVI